MKRAIISLFSAWGYFTIVMVLSLAILLVPSFIFSFLAVLMLAILLLEGLKLNLWLTFRERCAVKMNTVKPMVSVHLAICNEPPALVISTIRGIIDQNYHNFELIVVDNNTSDLNLWEPVSKFCASLSNVRFFHLSNWPFYKSGALNFARKVTNKKAEFIFVIDADYQLTIDAMALAVSNIEGPKIALVQFPQAYNCKERKHIPIVEEFDHFFDYYCFKADTCHGALATGTLSLIRLSALDGVGGWPTNSITEDAELGARLQVAGFDIKYVHRIVGKGIAPIHQEDFIKQRKRWIFGNIQTLCNYRMRPWQNFEKWTSGISQLTAWANMLGMPILILLCCSFLYPWLKDETFISLSVVAYLGYWIFTLSKMLRLQLVQGKLSIMALKTFLIHFSSLGIGAFHWWPVLIGRQQPFVRTDKSNSNGGYIINLLYPFLHLSLLFLAINAESFVVALSALTFCILHIWAIRFDYISRAVSNSKISLNLKLHL